MSKSEPCAPGAGVGERGGVPAGRALRRQRTRQLLQSHRKPGILCVVLVVLH